MDQVRIPRICQDADGSQSVPFADGRNLLRDYTDGLAWSRDLVIQVVQTPCDFCGRLDLLRDRKALYLRTLAESYFVGDPAIAFPTDFDLKSPIYVKSHCAPYRN